MAVDATGTATGGGAAAAVPPPGTGGRRRQVPWLGLLFLAPALILLGALVLYPIVFSIVRSLFDAGGETFVGLGNYGRMFTDHDTLIALRNNVIWVVVAPTIATALGLIFAVLTERIRWATAFKALIFMPMAVSFLATGVIFRLVYDQDPAKGVANAVVVSVHDLFNKSSEYPGAFPRDKKALPAHDGGYETAKPVAAGTPAMLPLVGFPPAQLPDSATQAKAAEPSSGLSGTVWLDFKPGGGGTSGVIDPGEKGMPGVVVQAVRDGSVVATATTADDGTFHFDSLSGGAYTLLLPQSNFAEPFNGVLWLGPTLVTPAIIASYIWIYAGFAMVLIAAGLASIPRDTLEAARVDGATEWQVFRRVTMPLLSPVLVVVFVTLVINVLKIFDLVYIMAPGSVQAEANVLALQMWLVSFGGGNDFGFGSAIGVFLFLLVIPAMAFNIRRFVGER